MKTQLELINDAAKATRLAPQTVAWNSNMLGVRNLEPLTFGLAGLIQYAQAHEMAFGDKLSEDYILGPAWLDCAKGYRALLNGNGAIANSKSISTDSKDNGVCEALFWQAMDAAGFKESDI